MVCERAGECELQELAYKYQIRTPVFHGERRIYPTRDGNPFVERDMEKSVKKVDFHRSNGIPRCLHSGISHHPEGHSHHAHEIYAQIWRPLGDNISLHPKKPHYWLSKEDTYYCHNDRKGNADDELQNQYVNRLGGGIKLILSRRLEAVIFRAEAREPEG
jgi:hypothetical protein